MLNLLRPRVTPGALLIEIMRIINDSVVFFVSFIIYPTSKDRKSSPDDPLIINDSVVFFVSFIIYPTSKDRKSSPDDPLIINDSVVFFGFSPSCILIKVVYQLNL